MDLVLPLVLTAEQFLAIKPILEGNAIFADADEPDENGVYWFHLLEYQVQPTGGEMCPDDDCAGWDGFHEPGCKNVIRQMLS